MNRIIWIVGVCFFMLSCTKNRSVLYQSEKFIVYKDGVKQGKNEATVIARDKIVSNYQSLTHENYSRLITFKFSINEKDNERPSGADHWIIIDQEHESKVIRFGEETRAIPADPGTKLPPNYEYTFKLDMNPVLDQFKTKGYYEAFDGSRIAKDDFKGVYIAGGSYPLSWDFSNLDENGLGLKDDDGDGIYELSVVLNPFDENSAKEKIWEASVDVSDKPVYQSEQKVVDALFNLSLEEARLNIEADSTLRTGAKWGGVWTRDVSYSILLAFAYHEPEVAKISLMKKVKRNRIIQDTGSGGAWPVSSDRTTWALGAWEVYKVTGDQKWLETAYEIIKNTLDDDYLTIRDAETGMYCGESSFLDWREQTYPKWMSNMDIYVSQNLGTNAVHYQAHQILVEMAKLLGKPYSVYEQRANEIKKGINELLWMKDKGYYAQYLYGRSSLLLSPRFEALGEALAILFDVADGEQARSIVSKSPLTEFGTTCIYPQIPDIPPYHNNAIWPFVQSYWNMAAAKAGNEQALNHGLAAIYRAGALFLTNYENFVAQNGDYVGTEINSHRMLWSMAGNIAMVHRVFMGMEFKVDGLGFNPVIPEVYGGKRSLSNYKYRDAILNIQVEGYGNKIKEFWIDGKIQDEAFVSSDLKGEHFIMIKMNNNSFSGQGINHVVNRFSSSNPHAVYNGSAIEWEPVDGAKAYGVYKDGELLKSGNYTSITVADDKFAEYAITAINEYGDESFSSEPILLTSEEMVVEPEEIFKKSSLPYSNYTGTGFIKTSTTENKTLDFIVKVKEAGEYLLDVRYANGTGPWNTDNNCCIRSLYVNNEYNGVLVMPQRGEEEWSDWGRSNAKRVNLNKGSNNFSIVLEEWNTNMDGLINEALIDQIIIISRITN
ncbi:MGH1-like glycoside hydrolase domain-containing protein [Plebeiibacterium marinum]|uniref:Alpha-L-rhamnosidase six-hairpin glycosidase domain-containing protein n=1 Tax=Plebeiibacterium marinum TaxID=2992111 RepID=A0AAE3MH51_9BACT|nr:hypothetical protein [Plebeiobacterium marinum]MCW3807501.1 hypothetical protein [Plebeiobacterium marinum]